ncbi:MAG: spermidine synthase [Deltaproteobacteria bacterium]|nr:spermidine synthase [Deltaproteobacteria bacterium]
MSALEGDWLFQRAEQGECVALEIRERLQRARTPFQLAEIVETLTYGRGLILDGLLQAAEADEFIYHESLVHPALLACPARGEVAVLGGGEGATLREVLRHRWVERAHMVDIDAQVVDFCRRHLETFHAGAFDDPRTELHIEDARAWLEGQPEGAFSAVIFDLSEPGPDRPSQRLFTRELFAIARRKLAPDGVFAMHAGPAFVRADGRGAFFPRTAAGLGAVFGAVEPYAAYIHSFADTWTFLRARGSGAWPAPGRIDALIAERIDGELRHYDAGCHLHMANLPRYLRVQLDAGARPFTDSDLPD